MVSKWVFGNITQNIKNMAINEYFVNNITKMILGVSWSINN